MGTNIWLYVFKVAAGILTCSGLSVVSCGVVNDGFMMSDHLPLIIETKRQT